MTIYYMDCVEPVDHMHLRSRLTTYIVYGCSRLTIYYIPTEPVDRLFLYVDVEPVDW